MGSSPKTFYRCAPLGARHRGGPNHYAIVGVRFPRSVRGLAAVGELDEIPIGVADPD